MTIKFVRWNRGQPFQTSLAPSAPWILTQIQSSKNFVELAVHELDKFQGQFGQNYTKENVQMVPFFFPKKKITIYNLN